MTEENLLTRLREYRSFLETQYNQWEDMRTGKISSQFSPQFCDAKADSYMIAKQKLEEMFPELYVENLTQIIDGVQGEEADSLDSPIGLRQLSEE